VEITMIAWMRCRNRANFPMGLLQQAKCLKAR
jgi:hypothetical protein